MESSLSIRTKFRNGEPPFKVGRIRIIRYTNWLVSALKRIPGSMYDRFVRIDGELLTIHSDKDMPPKHSFSLFNSRIEYAPQRKEIELTIGTRLFHLYCDSIQDADDWASNLQAASERSFQRFYKLIERISSSTFICSARRQSNRRYFVDFIATPEGIDPNILSAITAEREVLSNLDSRCTNGIVDMFRDQESAYFVRARRSIAENFRKFLERRSSITEKYLFIVAHDVLCGLRHMHSMQLAHRNLKPDNILWLVEEKRVVLDGFSWAKPFPSNITDLNVFEGSVGPKSSYTAPEILNGERYGPAADIFAAGTIIYEMAVGNPPPRRGRLFEEEGWTQFSVHARNCVTQMLCKSPKRRPPAFALLQHRWISENLDVYPNFRCSRAQSQEHIAEHGDFMRQIKGDGLQKTKSRNPALYRKFSRVIEVQNALSRVLTYRRKLLVRSRAIFACIRLMNMSKIPKAPKRWAPLRSPNSR